MSADSTHLAGGMEREDWERNLFKYYYYHFCYYYCGRIAKMCVRGACMTLPAPSLPLLLGTVLR